MRKGPVFILGLITGAVITIILAFLLTYSFSSLKVSYYDEPGEALLSRSMIVFQASPNGRNALVSKSGNGRTEDQVYFFIQPKRNNTLYDGQEIKAPSGSAFRIVGTYSYETSLGPSTVPAIMLMDRKATDIPKL